MRIRRNLVPQSYTPYDEYPIDRPRRMRHFDYFRGFGRMETLRTRVILTVRRVQFPRTEQ